MNRAVRAELSFDHPTGSGNTNRTDSARALGGLPGKSRDERQAQRGEGDALIPGVMVHQRGVIAADGLTVKRKFDSGARPPAHSCWRARHLPPEPVRFRATGYRPKKTSRSEPRSVRMIVPTPTLLRANHPWRVSRTYWTLSDAASMVVRSRGFMSWSSRMMPSLSI